jgi:hypothetical protein
MGKHYVINQLLGAEKNINIGKAIISLLYILATTFAVTKQQ